MSRATFEVAWSQRVLGLVVLVAAVVAAVLLRGGAPAPSWVVVAVFGVAAAVASVANFGDRVTADESGLSYENVLTRRLGWARARHAPWDAVASATELDGRTWFVEVQGQRRWVLDHLAGHGDFGALLAERGVPLTARARPRLRDLARGTGQRP